MQSLIDFFGKDNNNSTESDYKLKYSPKKQKTLLIANEQVCGNFIKGPPPELQKPVLNYPKLTEKTEIKISTMIYDMKDTKNMLIPLECEIEIKNHPLEIESDECTLLVKLNRKRNFEGYQLNNTPIIMKIVIGDTCWTTNPFLLRTNQTQLLNQSIIESKKAQFGGKSRGRKTSSDYKTILSTLNTIHKNILDLDKKITIDKENGNPIEVYVQDFKYKNLLSFFGTRTGVNFVYDKKKPHEYILIDDTRKKRDASSNGKKKITQKQLIELVNKKFQQRQ